MTAQHTPGPWTVSNDAIYGSSGLIKPLVAYLDDRFDDAEAANNARLIAAAPDLLVALENCVNVLSRTLPLFDDESTDDKDSRDEAESVVDTALAAIAKATGGAA